MVRLHLGSVGERVSRAAMGRNTAFVSRTPRSYTAVVSRMIGRSPRHVIVPAHRNTSATDDSNAPFQCRSQDPPAPLDRVVLAVVRRQVRQFHRHPVPVREPHHAVQELRPRAGDLGAVVQLDVQPPDAAVGHLPFVPPEVQPVGQEVARLLRVAEQEPRLVDRHRPAVHLQNPERDQDGPGSHVVVERLHRFRRPALAAAGEVAHLHLRLGVDGDPQRVRVGRGLGAGLLDVGEDGVGLGDLFCGRAF